MSIYDFIEIEDFEVDSQMYYLCMDFGIEFVRKLMKNYGGENIYIPTFHNRGIFKRKVVEKLRSEGKTNKQIASVLGVGERHVSDY